MLADVAEADPGLGNVTWSLITALERHGLVWSTSMEDPEYSLSQYGESFLDRLADEPADN
jgi:ribosomal protein S19E (S16A)